MFELNRMLIDKDRMLDGVVSVLDHARTVYNTMVLWSHESLLHMDKQVAKFDKHSVRFDLVLSNKQSGYKSCKNLLYL